MAYDQWGWIRSADVPFENAPTNKNVQKKEDRKRLLAKQDLEAKFNQQRLDASIAQEAHAAGIRPHQAMRERLLAENMGPAEKRRVAAEVRAGTTHNRQGERHSSLQDLTKLQLAGQKSRNEVLRVDAGNADKLGKLSVAEAEAKSARASSLAAMAGQEAFHNEEMLGYTRNKLRIGSLTATEDYKLRPTPSQRKAKAKAAADLEERGMKVLEKNAESNATRADTAKLRLTPATTVDPLANVSGTRDYIAAFGKPKQDEYGNIVDKIKAPLPHPDFRPAGVTFKEGPEGFDRRRWEDRVAMGSPRSIGGWYELSGAYTGPWAWSNPIRIFHNPNMPDGEQWAVPDLEDNLLMNFHGGGQIPGTEAKAGKKQNGK